MKVGHSGAPFVLIRLSMQLGRIPYLPVYNAYFFPTEKAPKIKMRIIQRILCFRLASLISLSANKRNVSIHNHLLLIEKLKTEPIKK